MKKMIVPLLLLALCGAGIGFYFFNKGPVDVKHSRGIEVTAEDLYKQYDTDSSGANKKYSGKILQVSGEITDISTNADNIKIITLKTGSSSASINCTMEELTETPKASEKINVKGICSGIGQGDADLGLKGDVYLSRCFLVK